MEWNKGIEYRGKNPEKLEIVLTEKNGETILKTISLDGIEIPFNARIVIDREIVTEYDSIEGYPCPDTRNPIYLEGSVDIRLIIKPESVVVRKE